MTKKRKNEMIKVRKGSGPVDRLHIDIGGNRMEGTFRIIYRNGNTYTYTGYMEETEDGFMLWRTRSIMDGGVTVITRENVVAVEVMV